MDITEYKSSIEQLVTANALLVACLLVVLVLIIVYMYYKSYSSVQGFMPTATLRMQQNDNPLVMSAEHATAAPAPMASGDAQAMYAANAVGSTTGSFTIDPNAAPGAPGSLGYQVLNSPDFNCAAVTSVPNNAWNWMYNVLSAPAPAAAASSPSAVAAAPAVVASAPAVAESLMGSNMKNDNQLSALLAGY